MSDVCRWGILGAANIARKNWKSIRNAGNCTLTGVASRDIERAEQFIAECQAAAPFDAAPRAFADYDQLIHSPQVDAIYIPLPTGSRKPWVLKAAAAGKHVLCEKPCGASLPDLQEMVDACREHGVLFMDGVMFMHSERLPAIRATLDDGVSVGEIKRITSQFSFKGDEAFLGENIRLSGALEPAGCLGDLGWYNIRFTLWALQYQMPQRVRGQILRAARRADSGEDVPIEFSAEMFFAGGVSASFYCSFITEHQQWANISGDKGFLQVHDFVLPYFGAEAAFDVANAKFHVEGCDFNMERHVRTKSVREYSSGYANAQETKLFSNFAQQATSGQLDQQWSEIAIKTQQVMEAVLQSARQDGQAVEL